jgi:hypothetical protein
MSVISRVIERLSGAATGPSRGNNPTIVSPAIVIAERFVPPAGAIHGLRVPGAIDARLPGRALAAMVTDAAGTQARQGSVARCPTDPTQTEIHFERALTASGEPLWLFVIDAENISGFAPAELVTALLRHGQSLGPRPPIGLSCLTGPDLTPVTTDEVAPILRRITFAMLSEEPDPALLPRLDQPDVDEAGLTPEQRAWRADGVAILPGFLPDTVIDPYIARREKLDRPGGWSSPTPYEHVAELRQVSLYPPLRAMLRELIGEEMMLHLNLTGWVSTERNWHQDDYLNPGTVNSWYAAVWIALDTIDPDSGPFEYVPGSHRWPLLRGEKVRAFMTEDERAGAVGTAGFDAWPKVTERFVVPAIEAEIRERDIPARRFLGRKGDVLIWHGRLMHRGTQPVRTDLQRRALIAHYSGVSHRPDMPRRQSDRNGGVYAVFDHKLV